MRVAHTNMRKTCGAHGLMECNGTKMSAVGFNSVIADLATDICNDSFDITIIVLEKAEVNSVQAIFKTMDL